MTDTLAKTPLCDWHGSHGARLVDFAGWLMPVQYVSIVKEHQAVREAAGLFDISHMGRLFFYGSGGEMLLDRLLTRRVRGMRAGGIRYSLVTNEQGGILDDVLVYRLEDAERGPFHLLVVNAGNREKIASWIRSHQNPSDEVEMTDRTAQTAMIAVQGPRACEIVQPLVDADLGGLKYYTGVMARVSGVDCVVSRTGYSGEDGCELIAPAEEARRLWEEIFAAGAGRGLAPAGLGARDTLRLEAAMPLYGHELSEQINPYQAGLGFAVDEKERDFIGREALMRLRGAPDLPVRIGLELPGKRVPREGYGILQAGRTVGEVTSGTFSPTLQRPIAMGYARREAASVGGAVEVDIRGRREASRVVKLPFYTRSS